MHAVGMLTRPDTAGACKHGTQTALQVALGGFF